MCIPLYSMLIVCSSRSSLDEAPTRSVRFLLAVTHLLSFVDQKRDWRRAHRYLPLN
jgi:hypothetical protein